MMDPDGGEIPGRVVALDYGRRRIGIAATDPLRVLAQPRGVIRAGSPPTDPSDELLRRIDEFEPRVVVVGIPLHMSGEEGEMAREARAFATALAARCGAPVVLRDERLTTQEAERTIRDMDLPKKKRERRGLRDAIAAAVLLEDYLRETGTP